LHQGACRRVRPAPAPRAHARARITSFGSALGLSEIQGEPSTQNGAPFDALLQAVPALAGGSYALERAADGLQYATRDALLAYLRGGVTAGIVAPQGRGLVSGLSTEFATGSMHKLQKGTARSGPLWSGS
jgi:hypothetical protein